MKMILVATDFSERSDRALRRAALLARQFEASLYLVHVVDDDQPQRIVASEREAAATLLQEQARTLREVDGIGCDSGIILGSPFEGIAMAADDLDPDLVVVGPHRRKSLRDVFVGTTAERTIRGSRKPVLMANSVPAGVYHHVLLAVDLTEFSADMVAAVEKLGLPGRLKVSLLHVLDEPATGRAMASSIERDHRNRILERSEKESRRKLASFAGSLRFSPESLIVRHDQTTAATEICLAAQELSADLIVVGTRSRSGLAKLLLGCVAEEVLRAADRDVLAIPPATGAV